MFAYVVRRSIVGVIMLIVMSLVTFLLSSPRPSTRRAPRAARTARPELREQTRKALGYDQPMIVQWTDFLQGVVKGREYPNDPELKKKAPDLIAHCPAPCLGYSVVNQTTVNAELKDGFPISLSLALAALVMWLAGGVFFGVVAAVKKGTLLDRGSWPARWSSTPSPPSSSASSCSSSSRSSGSWSPSRSTRPSPTNLGSGSRGCSCRALTLALLYMAGYIRMTRAFVLESMSEDYVRTARAKGLKSWRVLVKHSMRAALTPLVTLVGLDFAALWAARSSPRACSTTMDSASWPSTPSRWTSRPYRPGAAAGGVRDRRQHHRRRALRRHRPARPRRLRGIPCPAFFRSAT